jgi:hypothetical protein
MSRRRTFVEINISSIPVSGLGGLGLLSLAGVVAATLPEQRVPVLTGLGGGAALAIVLVVLRRWRGSSRPGGDLPSVLFQDSQTRSLVREGKPRAQSSEPAKGDQRPMRGAGCEGLFRLSSVPFVVR